MNTGKKQPAPINTLQEKKLSGKKAKNNKAKDDRELIGVDDKLIGDDLDIDEAEHGYEKEGVLNKDNVY